jgi:hypothetical protein
LHLRVGKSVGTLDGLGVGDNVGSEVGAGLGGSVGDSVGDGVGDGVGAGLGGSVGDSVGDGVGDGVGAGLGGSVGDSVGDGVGDGVGAGVQASVLHENVLLSSVLQACATPAAVAAIERARVATPDPQSTVQLLQAVQAEMAQSTHAKSAQGVVSVSPPHWAPPKAAASITYFKRDEKPAAPRKAVGSYSHTRRCGGKRWASTGVHHSLTSPRLPERLS